MGEETCQMDWRYSLRCAEQAFTVTASAGIRLRGNKLAASGIAKFNAQYGGYDI